MEFGEKIYLHITKTHQDWWTSMDFGVTNKSPASLLAGCQGKGTALLKIMPGLDDELCLCLNADSTFSISMNGVQQDDLKLSNISLAHPVWLVIHLYSRIREIRISNKQIKTKKIVGSLFREYC